MQVFLASVFHMPIPLKNIAKGFVEEGKRRKNALESEKGGG